MAYLGRKGASSPLTSADIPAGSVSAVKVASDVATQAELDAQKTNSSITTLGTITAGNLANTAIVYPAGHVVNISSSGVTTILGGISNSAHLVGSFQPTLSSASNKVLVTLDFLMWKDSATSASYFPLSITGGGIISADQSLFTSHAYAWSQYERQTISVIRLDSSPGSTTPTYNLYQGTAVSDPSANYNNLHFTCIEIKG